MGLKIVYALLASAFLTAVLVSIILMAGMRIENHLVIELCRQPRWPILLLMTVTLLFVGFSLTRKNVKYASFAGCGFGLIIAILVARG